MNWSLSKLGTFQKCPAQYKYGYIDKLPRKASPSASRGIQIHQDIELFFTEGKPLPPQMSMYNQWLTGLKAQEHYSELKMAMLKDWVPCEWENSDVWWKGVLDLLVRAPPQAWVFDWKSGKMYPDHDDQKELYSIATFIKYPDITSVRAIHVYVDLGKSTEKVYSRDELDWLIRKWNVKIHPLLTATEFIPTPNFMCRYCSYSKDVGGPCRF